MDAAVQSFNETVSERAKLKNAAYHKKNGSAVPKLGNKFVTNKEIEEKHGEVITYPMWKFMSFNEFKAMPKDLQVNYINNLQDKYDIGIKHISTILFHIGNEGLRSHLKLNGILQKCNPDKKRGKTGLDLFQQDIWDQERKERYVTEIDEGQKEEKTNQVYTVEQFKALEPESMKRYVNDIIREYGVGLESVSELVFHKSKSWLGYCLKTAGLLPDILKIASGSRVSIIEGRKRLKNDVEKGKLPVGSEHELKLRDIPHLELRTDDEKKEPYRITEKDLIDYQTFKNLPDEEKVQFLNSIFASYKIGYQTVGKELFGLYSPSTLWNYLKNRDLIKKFLARNTGGDDIDGRRRFIEDIQKARGIEQSDISEEETKMPEVETKPADKKPVSQPVYTVQYEDIVEEPDGPGDIYANMVKPKKAEPEPEPETKPVTEAFSVDYKNVHFETTYISDGLNLDPLHSLEKLFAGQKVQVSIIVSAL